MTGGSGQVLRTSTGRKTLPRSTSFPIMGEIAGVNKASLSVHLHSTKKRARWAEGFNDELNGHVFDLERDGLRPGCTLPKTHHAVTTSNHTIPDRSPPGSTRTAPSAVHQDGCVKYTTGEAIEDSRKRQHLHRHLEHKDTRSCRKTSGTIIQNEQVQMAHPWTL